MTRPAHVEYAGGSNGPLPDEVLRTKLRNAPQWVTDEIDTFRELPDRLRELEHLKDKTLITYCTGGIRCEKLTPLMRQQGFEKIYQLHGGILRYAAETGGENFEGQCYVFDNRVAVDVNKVNPTVVAKCFVCGTQTERMVNCANPTCNTHVTICPSCGIALDGACSVECQNAPEKRPYNEKGYYATTQHGYVPGLGYPGTKPKARV
jgi:UPF0176 protein